MSILFQSKISFRFSKLLFLPAKNLFEKLDFTMFGLYIIKKDFGHSRSCSLSAEKYIHYKLLLLIIIK